MEEIEIAPLPRLAHAFDMSLERGESIDVGDLAIGGRRVYVPINGGSFLGEGLAATVVGGSETLFERGDGVTVVEAVFYIRSAAGWNARAFGNGYRTTGGDFSGTRLGLLFEADQDGPLSHLTALAFIAEQPAGSQLYSISRIT